MLFRESGFESKRWGTRGVEKVGAKESGRTKGRRMQIKLLDSEEIKKRKDLKATSSQPYGISDKEQALLLVKISCQNTGPCRK